MGDGSEMGRSLALYLILDKEESPQPNRKVYAKFKLRVLDHRRINHSEKQCDQCVMNFSFRIPIFFTFFKEFVRCIT